MVEQPPLARCSPPWSLLHHAEACGQQSLRQPITEDLLSRVREEIILGIPAHERLSGRASAALKQRAEVPPIALGDVKNRPALVEERVLDNRHRIREQTRDPFAHRFPNPLGT